MPRIPREFLLVPGLSFHKVWRGHNKEWNLATPSEKKTYLAQLKRELPVTAALHALATMNNHSHELYTAEEIKAFSEFMRRHHTRYGLFFNKKHDRRGKVAQDRPWTCAIEDDAAEMRTTFYVHANPLRAGLVKDAKDYPYSTHKLYAYGKREKWMPPVTFPQWYLTLGKTTKERQRKYRELFDAYLREYGLIKQNWSVYGIGSLLWWSDRRRSILDAMKDRYGPAP